MKRLLILSLGIFIITAFSAFKKHEIPTRDNIIRQQLIFSHVSHPRVPRGLMTAVLHDDYGEKIMFTGRFVNYLEQNYFRDKRVVLYWFNSCHDWISPNFTNCRSIIAVDPDKIDEGIEDQLKSREWHYLINGFVFSVIMVIFWVGYFTMRNDQVEKQVDS